MVICFNCKPDTKRQLDALLSQGDYADYSEVIATAVANQAVLSERVPSRRDLLFISRKGEQPITDAGVGDTTRHPVGGRISGDSATLNRVPPIFSRDGLEGATLDLADQRADGWDSESGVPASRWLWGQFNRFLPAKASCRALARLQLESPSGVSLADAAPKIAAAAAELGDYLWAHDLRFGLKRDDAVAVAFPHSGPDLWKAQHRYAAQFVGSVNTEGAVSGMLIDLKLFNWDGARDAVRVRLTEAGWKLAQLTNPLLDEQLSKSTPRLSTLEVAHLLGHIHRSVRPEDCAYRSLMTAIDDGADTPDALDDAVAAINEAETPQMSRAFISTQRSGAIARMADLGLVARVRSGLSVKYAVTEAGRL